MRLQPLMADLISPYQSAFIKGRLIRDNILVTTEVMNYAHTCRSKRNYWAPYKIGFNKAFDSLSWKFIEAVLKFPSLRIKVNMECITSVTYQVTINGKPAASFHPQRGLGQ